MARLIVIVSRHLGEGRIAIHRDRAVGSAGCSYVVTRFQVPVLSSELVRELLTDLAGYPDEHDPDG